MATLLALSTGARVSLCAYHLVGRSARSELVLNRPVVSSDHAMIRWTGSRWEIRDLGSRNGTWVDGRRLAPNEPTPLAPGRLIAFGHPEERFRVLDVAPPATWARPLPRGTARAASDATLALPDDDNPRALVYSLPDGRWVLEQEGEITQLSARTVVQVDGVAWEIHLGEPAGSTLDGVTEPLGIAELAILVDVPQDSPDPPTSLRVGQAPVDFSLRSFREVLVELIRARLDDDGGAGLPEDACGWVDADALATRLGVDRARLGVQLFRARRVLGGAGVPHPSGLFERRAGGREVRLGFPVRPTARPA